MRDEIEQRREGKEGSGRQVAGREETERGEGMVAGRHGGTAPSPISHCPPHCPPASPNKQHISKSSLLLSPADIIIFIFQHYFSLHYHIFVFCSDSMPRRFRLFNTIFFRPSFAFLHWRWQVCRCRSRHCHCHCRCLFAFFAVFHYLVYAFSSSYYATTFAHFHTRFSFYFYFLFFRLFSARFSSSRCKNSSIPLLLSSSSV